MSFLSANSPFEDYRQKWESNNGLRLAEHFCNVSHFLCRLRMQMRYGEFTRAPLKLHRLEILADSVACDWFVRPPDPWDVDLPKAVALRHTTLQTLRDAIDMRSLIFQTFHGIETAQLRVYRNSVHDVPELIVSGFVQRNDNSSRWLHSITMRARVLGFRFHVEDDALWGLPPNDSPLHSVDG